MPSPNVQRINLPWMCFWHMGPLIGASFTQEANFQPSFLYTLHQRLSYSESLIMDTEEHERRMRLPKHEEIVKDLVHNNHGTSKRTITSHIAITHMTVLRILHTNDMPPLPSNVYFDHSR
ncbi:hypothetical protein TNCV_1140701 [Trichonephila clavipes]|nr:hypothetical protein TNCV_1140701 [Trichonephila clavipes]